MFERPVLASRVQRDRHRCSTAPDLGRPVAMAAVQRPATQGGNASFDTDLVLAAEDGSVWFGLIDATLAVTWTRLHDIDARVDVRPAATTISSRTDRFGSGSRGPTTPR